jgi:Mg-chelatase subunit ChlD
MRIRYVLGAVVLLGMVLTTNLAHGRPPSRPVKPRVEVVFCLDTTGSMTGLIDGAKQKIWSICNKIASGQPTPDLKVGLVAYRDRGDEYITKVFDLSDDLDTIHSHLMGFQAEGGGDEPESVNEALCVAVNKIQWSSDDKVLRIIYLVGDAPPHMDYANDIPYKVSCRKACERGIIINTIQCGNIQATTPFWQDIARKAEGRYVQIAQDGGVQQVNTPYDARLAEINAQLVNTSVVYGDAPTQAWATSQMQCAAQPACSPPTGGVVGYGGLGGIHTGIASVASTPSAARMVAADRAGYCASTGQVGAWDLVDSIKAGRVKLEELKTEQLPAAMQKLNAAGRKDYLAKVEAERNKLQAEAKELDRKRSEHIEQELRKTSGSTGFDGQVMEMLRDQAQKIGVAY